MDLMNLGNVSRKTGLKAKLNSKRDPNGMEDLNDFFQLGSDTSDRDVKPSISSKYKNEQEEEEEDDDDELARRLSFKRNTYKSPKRTISHKGNENSFSGSNDVFAPVSPPSNKRNSHYIKSLETLSPILKSSLNNGKTKIKKNIAPLATKKMVLGKSKNNNNNNNNRRTMIITGSQQQQQQQQQSHDQFNAKSKQTDRDDGSKLPLKQVAKSVDDLFGTDSEEDIKPEIEDDHLVTRKRNISLELVQQEQPTQQDELESPPIPKSVEKTTTTLKSTEPISNNQPIRRSTRHRIPTLLFWRNEKIVYNTTKENGAVVHGIDDVIHVPDVEEEHHRKMTPSQTSKSSSSSSVAKKRRRRISSSVADNNKKNIEIDYESDPEIEGSEWFKKDGGRLEIEVFDGPDSDNKMQRVIAWTLKLEKYFPKRDPPDNFNLAVLFDLDREFAAAGMLELPLHGIKLMKKNDDTYFMFYVVKGLLEVTVNDTKFVVVKGCSFEVPMGNQYQLVNIGKSIAKLFFVQAKYVNLDADEDWD